MNSQKNIITHHNIACYVLKFYQIKQILPLATQNQLSYYKYLILIQSLQTNL